MGLYSEKITPGKGGNQSDIEAAIYYEGITNKHFNMRVFWGWTLSAVFHGVSIFLFTAYFLSPTESGL